MTTIRTCSEGERERRGGSNPIESSEPSISDPSRRVKGGRRIEKTWGEGRRQRRRRRRRKGKINAASFPTRKRHPTWIHLLLRVQVTTDTRRCNNHDAHLLHTHTHKLTTTLYLFVHFDVEAVGHFVVLKSK